MSRSLKCLAVLLLVPMGLTVLCRISLILLWVKKPLPSGSSITGMGVGWGMAAAAGVLAQGLPAAAAVVEWARVAMLRVAVVGHLY